MDLLKKETPVIRGAHIYQDADPFVVIQAVEKFKVDKINFEVTYSVSAMATNIGFTMITAALVRWDTTQKEFESFRNRLMLTLGKNV